MHWFAQQRPPSAQEPEQSEGTRLQVGKYTKNPKRNFAWQNFDLFIRRGGSPSPGWTGSSRAAA